MRALVVVVGAAAALLVACAPHYEMAPPQEPQQKGPLAIAIISFGGTDDMPSEAEDGCVAAILDAGYRAVGRRQVREALPNENDVDYNKVGQKLGVDMIIDGGFLRGAGRVAPSLTPRLISTHSAGVLASIDPVKGKVKLTRVVGQKLCNELISQLP
jgi:TolB-like protein